MGIKTFVKEHKKELVIGGTALAAGVVIGYCICNKRVDVIMDRIDKVQTEQAIALKNLMLFEADFYKDSPESRIKEIEDFLLIFRDRLPDLEVKGLEGMINILKEEIK